MYIIIIIISRAWIKCLRSDFGTIAALARFVSKPVIVLVKSRAKILFVVSGLATRLRVENCVEQTATCATEDVVVPEIKRESTDSAQIQTEFMANVELADAAAKAFYFKFWIYDESELVNGEPVIVVAKKSISTYNRLSIIEMPPVSRYCRYRSL